ncbi:hypothetical protein DVH05_027246 [Phytophthora capsici]|nr:hypothetical protein DVH05_027246 [Phytophthora capsici]
MSIVVGCSFAFEAHIHSTADCMGIRILAQMPVVELHAALRPLEKATITCRRFREMYSSKSDKTRQCLGGGSKTPLHVDRVRLELQLDLLAARITNLRRFHRTIPVALSSLEDGNMDSKRDASPSCCAARD